MTKEAEIFKSKNFLNYEELSVSDFNKFPALTGIYNFTAGKYEFPPLSHPCLNPRRFEQLLESLLYCQKCG